MESSKIKKCPNCGKHLKLKTHTDKKHSYRYYICPNRDYMGDIKVDGE